MAAPAGGGHRGRGDPVHVGHGRDSGLRAPDHRLARAGSPDHHAAARRAPALRGGDPGQGARGKAGRAPHRPHAARRSRRLGGRELRPRGRRALRGPVPRRGAGRPLAGARRAPRGGRVASLARLARQPPAGHRRRQPGLPRARGARGLSLVAAAVDAGDGARGHALPRRPGWPRARLQLAQRDRDLVRARAPDPDAHRRGHVLSVGQQPPLHPHRQRASAAAPGRGRPARARGRATSAPIGGRDRARGRGPRCALVPCRAAGPGLDRHQCPAAAAGRCAGDLLHPGADRLASLPPLPARARSGRRRRGQVGALCGAEHGPAAAGLGPSPPYRGGGWSAGPSDRRPGLGGRGDAGLDRDRARLAALQGLASPGRIGRNPPWSPVKKCQQTDTGCHAGQRLAGVLP